MVESKRLEGRVKGWVAAGFEGFGVPVHRGFLDRASFFWMGAKRKFLDASKPQTLNPGPYSGVRFRGVRSGSGLRPSGGRRAPGLQQRREPHLRPHRLLRGFPGSGAAGQGFGGHGAL